MLGCCERGAFWDTTTCIQKSIIELSIIQVLHAGITTCVSTIIGLDCSITETSIDASDQASIKDHLDRLVVFVIQN